MPRLPFQTTVAPAPRDVGKVPWIPRSIVYVTQPFPIGTMERANVGRMLVPIVSPHGTPPAGTLGHVYVADLRGRFVGLMAISCLAKVPPNAARAVRSMLREHPPDVTIEGSASEAGWNVGARTPLK